MGIEYDPAKNERNIRERGLSFERAADLDISTARFAARLYGKPQTIAWPQTID